MKHEEYAIHVAIVDHIRCSFPQVKIMHIPNQSRDATEAFFNKKLGVLPGVSDLILGWHYKGIGVLEIKNDDGKLSNAQNRFLSWAAWAGWHTGIARTVRGAHNILCEWGLKPTNEAIKEPDLRTKEQKFQDVFDMYKPLSSK